MRCCSVCACEFGTSSTLMQACSYILPGCIWQCLRCEKRHLVSDGLLIGTYPSLEASCWMRANAMQKAGGAVAGPKPS